MIKIDLNYLIEILVKLRDEATPGIARLKAEINSLKSSQDADKATQDLGRSIKDLGDESDATRKKHEARRLEEERSRRVSEDAARGTKDLTGATERLGTAHDKASGSASAHTRSQQEFADALAKVRKESRDTESGLKDLELRISKVDAASRSIEGRRRAGFLSSDEVKRYSQDFSREYGSIANVMKRTYGIGSEEADRYRIKSEEALKASKEASRLARGDTGAKSFESLNESLSGAGSGFRITGVASFLQGLKDLSTIGLSQQLITGVASLAGSLISVASAAAQAGAALSGAFISGLGQAIPMISIVIASVERFKQILQAVSVAGQAEQQHFFDPTEKQRTQLQNVSSLISSSQQLTNSYVQLSMAQQRVRDSQIALTEARYAALRNITELSLAEKNARLQAEGADISLVEARRQLLIEIQKGDAAGLASAELNVKQAELGKRRAEFEVPKAEREARLARQRGVSGAPTVISAREGLEGSKLAVVQARQAAESAQRAEQITQLAQQARSSRETSTEAQLKFLEKSMSPTELGLTKALIEIEKELKSPSSPLKKITDYFVEPFTIAVERIRSLLKNRSFLTPIDELAKSMGAGLGRLEKATFGKSGTSFFETMAKDATTNIPIVVSSIEHLMHIFEDIAKAAEPAFHKLSEDWNNFWSKLDTKYSSFSGLFALENFFTKSVKFAEGFAHLGDAIFDLFKAIGHDAAPQGLATVNTFAQTVEKATSWVQSHGPEVTKFFKEAREGLSTIGGLLFNIGKDFLEAFSLSSLRALSGFLSQFLLPGLRDVINVIGKITTAILEFFNLFGTAGHKALEALAAFVLGFLAVAKAVEMVKELKKAFIELKVVMMESPWVAIATGILAAAAALGLFDEGQKKNKVSTEEADQALERQAEALRTIKNLNNEYKSSKLGAEEAKLQVRSSEQALVRAKQTPLQQGESSAERSLRIKQDEQSVERARLSHKERQESFERLPQEQRESSQRAQRDNQKSLSEARGRERTVSGEIKELESKRTELEESVPRTKEGRAEKLKELSSISSELVKKNNELKESQEQIARATQQSNKIIIASNELVSQGATKISDAYARAFRKFEESVHGGAASAKDGMGKIRKLVDESLKHYGVTPAEIAGAAHETHGILSGAAGIAGKAFSGITGHASGTYISATPGGRIARLGEDNYDEVVLSTDPAHAQRSRQLLGQYFSRAPHLAKGGRIRDYPGPQGRVDEGVDFSSAGPVRAVLPGTVKSTGLWPGWPGSGGLVYETIKGLIYIMENFSPIVKAGAKIIKNQVLGYSTGGQYGIETGWANASGTGPLVPYNAFQAVIDRSGGTASTAGGESFARFLGGQAGSGVLGFSSELNSISSPKIKGGGSIGKVAQNALNIATKAANIFLSKYSNFGSAPIPIGASAKTIVSYLQRAAGLLHPVAEGVAKVLGAESNLATTATGSEGAYGIAQWLGKRRTGLENFAHSIGKPASNLGAQLAYLVDELYGPEANTFIALKNAKSVTEAIKIFVTMFERPGNPAVVENRAAEFHMKDQGGIIGSRAPWGGRPVPIIAHEGERIMNPSQYGATARLAGMSPGGLDSYLGYDSSPRQSFASGGKPQVVHPGGVAQPDFESQIPDVIEINSLGGILKIFKAIKDGFKRLNKLVGTKNYQKELNNFIDEGEQVFMRVLEAVQQGREFIKARLERSAVEKEYSKRGGRIQIRSGGQTRVAEFAEQNLAEESKGLQDERNIIDKGIAEAKKIKNSNKRANALKLLMLKQKENGEAIDQNIEARYQAETQTIQARINDAENAYQVISQQQQAEVSKAQAFGNLDQISKLESNIRQSIESQISIYEARLREAEAIGNQELISSIKQSIIGLRQAVTNTIIETINNSISLIERESAKRESYSQLTLGRGKIQAQLGNFQVAGSLEQRGLEERGENLLRTRGEEERERAKAVREGDTAAVISLTEKINSNTLQIEENNLALKDVAIATRELILSQIQSETGTRTGVFGAAKQGVEAIGHITGFTNIPALKAIAESERGNLLGAEGKYEEQGKGLGFQTIGMTAQQVLQYLSGPQAQSIISRIETTGNAAEKKDLEKWLSEIEGNSVALLNNTEELAKLNGQLNQPQSFSTTAFSSFRSSFFSGMGGLLPTYSAALPPGSRPEGMPVYGSGTPGAPVGGTHIGPINLTHPVEKLDPALFGEELSHHIATTPAMS